MYNNFNNPYGYNPNIYQQPLSEYAFVDGIEGAKAYQLRPNMTMLLMDSNNPMCYKKTTDQYGKTTSIEIYDLVPHVEPPTPEYATKQDFMELKKLIEALGGNKNESV